MEWLLELTLIGLLAATLFHALRLERALGVLKRDRSALEELVATFNSSTRLAEQGIERLRDTADGAGRQISRQIETATGLKDDLLFLSERGERLADRLDGLVRAGRSLSPDGQAMTGSYGLQSRELAPVFASPRHDASGGVAGASLAGGDEASPRLRSQAERDLLKALRMGR